MKLSLLYEATTEWVGPIHNLLGDDSDWSLNYGTGDSSRPPFLYIKADMSLVNSAIAAVNKSLIVWAQQDESQGSYHNIRGWAKDDIKQLIDHILRQQPNSEVWAYPKLTHVGESHITISMAGELHQALDVLAADIGITRDKPEDDIEILTRVQTQGESLFDESGKGLVANYRIDRNDPFKVVRAGFYKDDVDHAGPLLIALNINTDLYTEVRKALGLPPRFIIPSINKPWQEHITLGYLPKKNMINRSFVSAHGSRPRHKKQTTMVQDK